MFMAAKDRSSMWRSSSRSSRSLGRCPRSTPPLAGCESGVAASPGMPGRAAAIAHGTAGGSRSAERIHTIVPRLSGTPGDIKWPGGVIGEHNVEVYRSELGLTCDEIQRLTEAGVL